MDILIKNMNKPKNSVLEEHFSDGSIVKHEVIELSPHGRLVDVDTIIERFEILRKSEHELAQNLAEHQHVDMSVDMLIEMIKKVPTILEANNG